MVDQPGNQDALVAQLKELNERSRTYARQFWQVPFTYLAAGAVLVAQLIERNAPARQLGLTVLGIVGLFITWHMWRLYDPAKRCVDAIQDVEARLSLRITAQWKPDTLNALWWLTLAAAVGSLAVGLFLWGASPNLRAQMRTYFHAEDLGADLRRECDSIVREYMRAENPLWSPERYEPLVRFCIERRSGLGEK